MATAAKTLEKYIDLQTALTNSLPINAARIKCMVLLIVSLIKVQSVNFERLAEGFDNKVDLGSNLRRIQRFFAKFNLDKDLIAGLLFKILPVKDKVRLTLDRTNWKFGKKNINILVIGVIYKGLSLPILWTFLGDKRGNSNQKERIDLLKRFIRLFGQECITHLVADREFVGDDWWGYLSSKDIPFFIRMRENMKVYLPHKNETIEANWLFRQFDLNTVYYYPKIVRIGNQLVYLSGMRYLNEKGKIEYLIVASHQYNTQTMDYYRERWQIETMFKAFKTAGFNLEDTHVTEYDRLDKILCIVALAFLWAYKVGIYRNNEVKPLKIKKHGRLEKSFFAYGLEYISQALLNAWNEIILTLTKPFLSCT